MGKKKHRMATPDEVADATVFNSADLKPTDDEGPKPPARRQLPRPFLTKRFGAAILDLLMFLAIAAGFEVIAYFGLFDALGYHAMKNEIHDLCAESGLFVANSTNGFDTISAHYDSNKTPEANYDVPITYFYSTDSRAIAWDKLKEYNAAKLSSGLYVTAEDNTIVRANSTTDATAKTWLADQYTSATTFFDANPIYNRDAYQTYMIVVMSCLVSATISSVVFYLVIPLTRRDGETVGQMSCHICLADERDDTLVKKWQISFRFFVLYCFDIALPILVYARWGYGSLIPLLITIAMICFVPGNRGPGDLLSRTYVINKSRSDEFSDLKAIKEKAQEEKEHANSTDER